MRKAKNIAHRLLALAANIVHSFPAKSMYVIGVTGTDGKSTTSYYLYQILKDAGKKVAYIGTTGAIINGEEEPLGLHVTTPSTFQLQKILKKAKESGAHYLVLEVTSHGLDQSRVWGIPFQIGLLTNVSEEHLDYHKSLENYARTKIRLLKSSRICIVGDDEKGFVKKYLKNKSVTQYGLGKNSQIDDSLFNIPKNLTDFNKKNMLGAIAAARFAGLTDDQINKSLPNLSLPKARLDTVYSKNFRIIIDFAHTTAAFKSLLPEVKKDTKGRLIHVFGAAGGRDSQKRQRMGEIAAQHDDIIILTSEDPRGEAISEINKQLSSNITNFTRKDSSTTDITKNTLFEIADRQKAIDYAVSIAKTNDTILLTGKGHEKSINISGEELPWDEYTAVEKSLKKR